MWAFVDYVLEMKAIGHEHHEPPPHCFECNPPPGIHLSLGVCDSKKLVIPPKGRRPYKRKEGVETSLAPFARDA